MTNLLRCRPHFSISMYQNHLPSMTSSVQGRWAQDLHCSTILKRRSSSLNFLRQLDIVPSYRNGRRLLRTRSLEFDQDKLVKTDLIRNDFELKYDLKVKIIFDLQVQSCNFRVLFMDCLAFINESLLKRMSVQSTRLMIQN